MPIQRIDKIRAKAASRRVVACWVILGGIVAAVLGAGVWRVAHQANRSTAGTAVLANLPAGSEARSLGGEDWQRLASLAGATRLAAVAVKSDQAIEPDGWINAEEWADAFRVTVPGGPAGGAGDLEIRCLWNDRRIAVCLAGLLPATGSAGWRLVVGIDGAEERFQFDCPRQGGAREYHLARDARRGVEPPDLRAAVRVQGERSEAEWVIPAEPFRACLAGGRGLSITIRSITETGSDPQPEDPPLYWLMSSLAGTSVEVVAVDPGRLPWPALSAANCLVDPGGLAVQWYLPRHDLAPGEALSLPLQARAADGAGEGVSVCRRLAAVGDPGAGLLEPIALASIAGDTRGLRQALLRLALPGRDGAYVLGLEARVGQACPSVAQLGLLVDPDARTALRRHLLQRREQVERFKAAPAFDVSVSRAHVVRCLQLADQRQGLTGDLLGAVGAMETAIAELANGRVCTVPRGRSVLAWRCPSGKDVTVVLHVPEHYDARLAWPLLASCSEAYAHPAMISLGMGGVPEAEVINLLGEVERLLRIDSDRVYLMGQCEGAYQATDLLVTWPDRWAAAVLGARAKWSALWANALHVPVRCYCSTSVKLDWLVTRAAMEWMRHQGSQVELIETPDIGHIMLPARYQRQLVAWCLGHVRGPAPKQVRLCGIGGQLPAARWLRVEGVQDASRIGWIEAGAEGAAVSVRTEGVAGYSVDLAAAPLDPAVETIRIIENDSVVAQVSRVSGPLVYRRQVPLSPPDDGPVLATLRQGHPDWQWQQWAASVACQHGRAQGLVADGLLKGSAAGLVGPIRARHIRACFENHWLVRGHFGLAAAAAFLEPAVSSGVPASQPAAGARPLVRYVDEPAASAAAADAASEYILLVPDEAGRTAPGMEDQPLPTWWGEILAAAERWELQEQFLAEDLVRHLAENPGIDLDAVLSSQPPPVTDAVVAEGLREVLP